MIDTTWLDELFSRAGPAGVGTGTYEMQSDEIVVVPGSYPHTTLPLRMRDVSTVDAAVGTLDTKAIATGYFVRWDVIVIGKVDDDVATWSASALFRFASGVAVLVDSVIGTPLGTAPGLTWTGPSFAVSGANMLLEVAGVGAAGTIQWASADQCLEVF